MKCQNKFWLENPADLLCSFHILPMKGMDLAEQMNSVTRLVVAVFLILLLLDIKKAIYFLVASIILIIIIYYIQKKGMETTEKFLRTRGTVEGFQQEYDFDDPRFGGDPAAVSCCAPREILTFGGPPPAQSPDTAVVEYRTPRDLPCELCTDVTPTGSGPDFYSRNQALAGQANPRTLIPPVIVPKSHDLTYWRANNLVIHSHINAESFVDTYQSGYDISNCCNYTCDKELRYEPSSIPGRAPVLTPAQAPVPNGSFVEGIGDEYGDEYFEGAEYEGAEYEGAEEGDVVEGFFPPGPPPDSGLSPYPPTNVSGSYAFPYYSSNVPQTGAAVLGAGPAGPRELGPLKSGAINVSCGYNATNVEVNLPTNEVSGMCPRDEAYTEYNKNLHTMTIQPNVFSRSQINEPINSNIGISFQQQFQPVTCSSNNDGLMYTLHDPRIIEPIEFQANDCPLQDSFGQRVNRSNIFDPRFNGYGTSYRSYTDPLTGQTRYNYSDIDLVKMPNYITRNKIDSFQFGTKYGPAKPGISLGETKALAQDKWLRDNLQQRNDLMERYMSGKINTRLAQLRKAPILTSTGAGMHNRCK